MQRTEGCTVGKQDPNRTLEKMITEKQYIKHLSKYHKSVKVVSFDQTIAHSCSCGYSWKDGPDFLYKRKNVVACPRCRHERLNQERKESTFLQPVVYKNKKYKSIKLLAKTLVKTSIAPPCIEFVERTGAGKKRRLFIPDYFDGKTGIWIVSGWVLREGHSMCRQTALSAHKKGIVLRVFLLEKGNLRRLPVEWTSYNSFDRLLELLKDFED
jgi:hypothetical protein